MSRRKNIFARDQPNYKTDDEKQEGQSNVYRESTERSDFAAVTKDYVVGKIVGEETEELANQFTISQFL